MSHFRSWVCVLLLVPLTAPVSAQPPAPNAPRRSPLEGVWYFRGDPRRVCFIETVNGPKGPRVLFTNEDGGEASGTAGPGGRVSAPAWKITGTVRGNRLTWSNGDYWDR